MLSCIAKCKSKIHEKQQLFWFVKHSHQYYLITVYANGQSLWKEIYCNTTIRGFIWMSSNNEVNFINMQWKIKSLKLPGKYSWSHLELGKITFQSISHAYSQFSWLHNFPMHNLLNSECGNKEMCSVLNNGTKICVENGSHKWDFKYFKMHYTFEM